MNLSRDSEQEAWTTEIWADFKHLMTDVVGYEKLHEAFSGSRRRRTKSDELPQVTSLESTSGELKATSVQMNNLFRSWCWKEVSRPELIPAWANISRSSKGSDYFLPRCCPAAHSIRISLLSPLGETSKQTSWNSSFAVLRPDTCFLRACVWRYAAWETLTFHTHLLTSLNSRCADSSSLPWPWGDDVHRAHGEEEHMQGENLSLSNNKPVTHLCGSHLFSLIYSHQHCLSTL